MKEKRYFCDFWFGTALPFKHFTALIILSMIGLTIICSIISYGIISLKYAYELDSYSESTYQYLNEIADNVISEGQGVDLTAIPSDVVKYEIVREDGIITFKYSLDNNKGMQFATSAHMTVELSENFDIVSKHPSDMSEEQYVRDIKVTMALMAFVLGLLITVLISFAAVIGSTIAAGISSIKKNKARNLS